MALIRWGGKEYYAEPIRELPSGIWLMKALSHGPRFSAGTEIMVAPSEILDMKAVEVDPHAPAKSLADLERDMAAERETLPSVKEVLAEQKKGSSNGQ